MNENNINSSGEEEDLVGEKLVGYSKYLNALESNSTTEAAELLEKLNKNCYVKSLNIKFQPDQSCGGGVIPS